MADNLTLFAGTGITQRTTVFAMAGMLAVQEPVVILGPMGKNYMVPRNKQVAVKFRRRTPLTAQTTPLAEGTTPALTSFAFEDESVTLLEYGRVIGISNRISEVHEDPVLQEIVTELGLDIGRTQEAINWAVVQSGTNVFYANGSQRTDVNTPVSLAKQRAVTRSLKENKAQKITRILAPGPNYGTKAVEAAYVGVAHTHHEADIRGLPGFTPVAEYGSMKPISPHEIGAVEDVRYILSPDLSPTLAGGSSTLNGMVSAGASAVDIYPIIYMGQDAWGTTTLKGMKGSGPSGFDVTVIPVEQKTKDDPLGQRGYAGYRFWHAALILNDNWIARLECGVTDL